MRILAYLAGILACGAAMADTTLVYNADENPFTVRIRPGEIRIDDRGSRWQLYRQADNAIFSVNPENNSYVRMDADTAATIRGQMQALRKRMEQQLAQLPAEQQAAARAALAGQVPGLGGEEKKVTVKATGSTDTVAGYECRIMQVHRGGEPAERLCVAAREALDLSKAEFKTVTGMFGLMERMLAGTGLASMGLPYLKLGGMPIRYENAAGDGKRTLSRVSHGALSDLVFEIPPSYEARRPQLDE